VEGWVGDDGVEAVVVEVGDAGDPLRVDLEFVGGGGLEGGADGGPRRVAGDDAVPGAGEDGTDDAVAGAKVEDVVALDLEVLQQQAGAVVDLGAGERGAVGGQDQVEVLVVAELRPGGLQSREIGRAACRERV